ncbi:phage holin family protein [Qipengyuania sp.]|uniref:phage holin family protein n=1 Tax=Qipengyuania sp. TaxID=2004515 RepID=UPI0035C7EB8B
MQQGRTEFVDELPPVADEDSSSAATRHSLIDDVEALFEDGKTYLEAEVAFQKSRAGFAGNRLKFAAVYGAMAFGFLHLALIALTVGIVIALTPVVGPWLATAIVVLALLIGGVIMIIKLRGKVNDIRQAFSDHSSQDPAA